MSDFEIISVVIMTISRGAAPQIFDLSRQRFSQSENSETSGFRPLCSKRSSSVAMTTTRRRKSKSKAAIQRQLVTALLS